MLTRWQTSRCMGWVAAVLTFLAWSVPQAATRAADPGGDAATVAVVRGGKALARVLLPKGASKAVQDAAALLVDCVCQRTGATLEVAVEPAPAAPGLTDIHCGVTAAAGNLDLGLDGLDDDGFTIAFPGNRGIVLAGVTDWGTEYAVYEFLERYAGVRWLLPGPAGEHVPAAPDLIVPAVAVRAQPAFRHRLFSGLGKAESAEHRGEQALWARRNRMHDRVQFHHNLWRLFLPEDVTAVHPDFYPVLDGKRFLPVPAAGKTTAQDVQAQVSWQPCFTAPGSVEAAVRNITEYFAKNPLATSYSLGINDTNRYCTCPACEARDGGRVNVIGVRDVSASYYTWCNAIAAGVRARYPDKWLGLLAYNGAYSPPAGLRLDERLVPFITYDRMKWSDAELERLGHQHTEQWAAAAAVLGWYDYIYGGQFYLMPRVYMHHMAGYVRYGYEHGVRHYYAEAYPSADWHEGPKLYVALKLLWDPYLDVEALLQDWYTAAVGPDAAPALARYFAFWEDFWTRRVLQTDWFRGNGNRQYLDFGSTGYAEALTREDLGLCAQALEEAVARAPEGPCRQRARIFLDGWRQRQAEVRSAVRLRHPEGARFVRSLVSNGFDRGVEGWGNWQRDYAKAVFSYDGAVGRAQAGALAVDAANAQKSPLCFTRAIPVERDRTYRASVGWRSAGLDDGASVTVAIKWKDAAGKWVNLATAEAGARAPFAPEWQRLDVYVATGTEGLWQEVHSAMVLLTVADTTAGRVWFDDFTFAEVQIPE